MEKGKKIPAPFHHITTGFVAFSGLAYIAPPTSPILTHVPSLTEKRKGKKTSIHYRHSATYQYIHQPIVHPPTPPIDIRRASPWLLIVSLTSARPRLSLVQRVAICRPE